MCNEAIHPRLAIMSDLATAAAYKDKVEAAGGHLAAHYRNSDELPTAIDKATHLILHDSTPDQSLCKLAQAAISLALTNPEFLYLAVISTDPDPNNNATAFHRVLMAAEKDTPPKHNPYYIWEVAGDCLTSPLEAFFHGQPHINRKLLVHVNLHPDSLVPPLPPLSPIQHDIVSLMVQHPGSTNHDIARMLKVRADYVNGQVRWLKGVIGGKNRAEVVQRLARTL